MILQVGDFIKVKTKTLRNVFGECVYKVLEVDLPSLEKSSREVGIKNGIRFMMMGGTGPSARRGLEVVDSEERISQNIKDGITVILSKEQGAAAEKYYGESQSKSPARMNTGVIEV